MEDKLTEAITKVALGFSVEEITEEYAADGEGELKLVKRKETRKDVPPDLKAVRLLWEERDLMKLSDEELERERRRLLEELRREEEKNQ